MNKGYRVFNGQLDYIECLDYDLEGDLLPQDITEFPAYVVYYDFINQWRAVNYDTFIQYLKTMRDEMREITEDINWYLDKEDDDGN